MRVTGEKHKQSAALGVGFLVCGDKTVSSPG